MKPFGHGIVARMEPAADPVRRPQPHALGSRRPYRRIRRCPSRMGRSEKGLIESRGSGEALEGKGDFFHLGDWLAFLRISLPSRASPAR
jgi:hypothetical protein